MKWFVVQDDSLGRRSSRRRDKERKERKERKEASFQEIQKQRLFRCAPNSR